MKLLLESGDGGSDAGRFTVTTRSVKSDEGHISILVDWKVMCVIALICQLTLTRPSDVQWPGQSEP